MGDIYHLWR